MVGRGERVGGETEMLLRLDHERIVGDELGATEYGGKGNLYACEGSDGRDKRDKRRLMGAM